MKLTELKGNWKAQKGLLMQKFAVLTRNDSMFTKGKEEKLLGRLQNKQGKSKNTLMNASALL